jgi:pilus assembly protein CpaE
MTIYLLGGSSQVARAIERRICRALPAIRSVRHLHDIPPVRFKQEEPDFVLLPTESSDPIQIDRVLDLVRRHSDQFFFVLMSEDISDAGYKRLTRSGYADWLSARASAEDVLGVIGRQRHHGVSAPAAAPPRQQANMPAPAVPLPRPQANMPAPAAPLPRPQANKPAPAAPSPRPRAAGHAPTAPQQSVLISFVPSAGGVGNSSLAVETAVQLKTGKATRTRRVCIVDLDFQSSHICDHLDIEPRLQIQEMMVDPQRFDEQMFDVFVSRHSSGVDVLAAPRRRSLNANDVNIDVLDALFDKMALRYDFMLADLPVTWFSWTRPVIAASRRIVVTGLNTVPGLRQTVETLAAVRGDGTGDQRDIAVAINRYHQRPFRGGTLRQQHIDRLLGGENVLLVRDEPAAVESINAGEPLAIAHSLRKINKDIAALADFCRGAGASPSRHTSSLLSRLLNG